VLTPLTDREEARGVRGGTLYVVATPLGHLGDLSARATELLRSVAVVAAEDTRRTRSLLSHLDAHPRLVSYHAHSDRRASAGILAALERNEDVALVTDAGTPGISDPGAELVGEVRAGGFRVVPVPGPSAVAAALSASGLPADRYVFLGFLPRKGTERERLLTHLGSMEWTAVLFEAPGRIGELLTDLEAVCGGSRRAFVARELTKVHEELVAGTLAALAAGAAGLEPRGEYTIVVEGGGPADAVDRSDDARQAAARLLSEGLTRKAVAGLLEDLYDMPRNAAYRIATEVPLP
jgi:16S rRNA (cytidine1402-2'-O)-methyltransferase